MSSYLPKKVFIQVESAAEQEETIKSSRKTPRALNAIQQSIDKENLVGRQTIGKDQLIKKATERYDKLGKKLLSR